MKNEGKKVKYTLVEEKGNPKNQNQLSNLFTRDKKSF